jgi:hypothetical protein
VLCATAKSRARLLTWVIRDREGRSRTTAYVRFAPKADAANDRRAAMLHWMTLSAASRPLGLRGRIDHISAGRVVRRCEALAAFVFRFRRTMTTSRSFIRASGLALSLAQDFRKQLLPGRLQ